LSNSSVEKKNHALAKTASEKTINGKKENKKENLERVINCHSSS
jgi:hypothetical protein